MDKIKGLIFLSSQTFILFFSVTSSKCQFNLVENSSFEIYDTCSFAMQINNVFNWTIPLLNTSADYFNDCYTGPSSYPFNFQGYQFARTGQGYIGLILQYVPVTNPANYHYKEYIQTQLVSPLISGEEYCAKFYVSACDSCPFVSSSIGIYFSNTEINDTCEIDTIGPPIPLPCNLPYQPQIENIQSNLINDRIGWMEISGSFIANGGEQYIVIGNFKDSSNTILVPSGWNLPHNGYRSAYVYIDDILIVPCDSLTTIENIEFAGLYCNQEGGNLLINSISKLKNLIIYTSIGQLKFKMLETDLNSFKIDLTGFSCGIYIFQFETNNKRYTKKIFIY